MKEGFWIEPSRMCTWDLSKLAGRDEVRRAALLVGRMRVGEVGRERSSGTRRFPMWPPGAVMRYVGAILRMFRL